MNIILERGLWCYDMGVYPGMIFVNDFDDLLAFEVLLDILFEKAFSHFITPILFLLFIRQTHVQGHI